MKRNGEKQMNMRSILAVGVMFVAGTFLVLGSRPAHATGPVLHCEQGNQNSWKVCELLPDTFARYVWTASGSATIDSIVCSETSSVCTAWCPHTKVPGYIHVTVYDFYDNPVASRTRSIGCLGG
jgi:hypothetical protein